VVPVSVGREQLRGRIDLPEVRRRQKRWLIGLGIPAALVVLGIFLWIQRGVAEVRAMGPWPGIEVSAEEIARVDLSQLGLEVDQIQDARDEESWAGGGYEEGVLITYESGGERVVAVWALRYETEQAANNDYSSAQAWTGVPGICGMSSYAHWGNSGVIRCWFGNSYDKILWNDTWIVDIVALEGSESTADVLVDQVRDAIAAHWKVIALP
jgi:hypothetical protein